MTEEITYTIGTIISHPKLPDWGIGVITDRDISVNAAGKVSGKIGVRFANAGKKIISLDVVKPTIVEPAKSQKILPSKRPLSMILNDFKYHDKGSSLALSSGLIRWAKEMEGLNEQNIKRIGIPALKKRFKKFSDLRVHMLMNSLNRLVKAEDLSAVSDILSGSCPIEAKSEVLDYIKRNKLNQLWFAVGDVILSAPRTLKNHAIKTAMEMKDPKFLLALKAAADEELKDASSAGRSGVSMSSLRQSFEEAKLIDIYNKKEASRLNFSSISPDHIINILIIEDTESRRGFVKYIKNANKPLFNKMRSCLVKTFNNTIEMNNIYKSGILNEYKLEVCAFLSLSEWKLTSKEIEALIPILVKCDNLDILKKAVLSADIRLKRAYFKNIFDNGTNLSEGRIQRIANILGREKQGVLEELEPYFEKLSHSRNEHMWLAGVKLLLASGKEPTPDTVSRLISMLKEPEDSLLADILDIIQNLKQDILGKSILNLKEEVRDKIYSKWLEAGLYDLLYENIDNILSSKDLKTHLNTPWVLIWAHTVFASLKPDRKALLDNKVRHAISLYLANSEKEKKVMDELLAAKDERIFNIIFKEYPDSIDILSTADMKMSLLDAYLSCQKGLPQNDVLGLYTALLNVSKDCVWLKQSFAKNYVLKYAPSSEEISKHKGVKEFMRDASKYVLPLLYAEFQRLNELTARLDAERKSLLKSIRGSLLPVLNLSEERLRIKTDLTDDFKRLFEELDIMTSSKMAPSISPQIHEMLLLLVERLQYASPSIDKQDALGKAMLEAVTNKDGDIGICIDVINRLGNVMLASYMTQEEEYYVNNILDELCGIMAGHVEILNVILNPKSWRLNEISANALMRAFRPMIDKKVFIEISDALKGLGTNRKKFLWFCKELFLLALEDSRAQALILELPHDAELIRGIMENISSIQLLITERIEGVMHKLHDVKEVVLRDVASIAGEPIELLERNMHKVSSKNKGMFLSFYNELRKALIEVGLVPVEESIGRILMSEQIDLNIHGGFNESVHISRAKVIGKGIKLAHNDKVLRRAILEPMGSLN